MRLIDADALKVTKIIEKDYVITDRRRAITTVRDVVYIEDIEKAPTIEAEPVRHGRWEWCTNHWECSVCRGSRFHDLVLGLDAAYCGRCGAKMMDKEEE